MVPYRVGAPLGPSLFLAILKILIFVITPALLQKVLRNLRFVAKWKKSTFFFLMCFSALSARALKQVYKVSG